MMKIGLAVFNRIPLITSQKLIYLCPFIIRVMSTVQILILIIIAVFVIVMVVTFLFLSHVFFMIPTTITPGLDGREVILSYVIPWT
jgi:hypothetical protein